MKLSLTLDKRYLEVIPETKQDFRTLAVFPGFSKVQGRRLAPAKVNVCKNLIHRLKRQVKEPLAVTKEVRELFLSEFRLKTIPSSFTYFTTPLKHQEIALRYLFTNEGGGLLLDPGLGKTKVVLDFIKLMEFKRSLVVCPQALLFVWQDEVAVHRPDLKIHVRRSMTWDKKIARARSSIQMIEDRIGGAAEQEPTKEELKKLSRYRHLLNDLISGREEDLAGDEAADVVVMNYERAVRGQLELIHAGYDFLAIDEGLVKDPSSQRTQALTSVSKMVKSSVIMSGTLVNNSPVDIFAPLRILEPSLAGCNLGHFKDRYCQQASVKDEAGNIKNKFIVGFKNVSEAASILQSVSIVMRKEEWLKDLPPKKFIEVKCTPTTEQTEKMDELAANYITTIEGEYLEVSSPLTVMAKLYQISNGFVYLYDDEDESLNDLFGREGPAKKRKKSDRRTIYFKDNPKIKELRNLYKTKLEKRKFILWYNTDAEYEMIANALSEDGVYFYSIRGGEKDTGGKVKEFNKNPNVQVLVCQARSVNYGITVLGTRPENLELDIEAIPDINPLVFTEVFFSLNFSLEVFLQQQDRIHRIGQTQTAEYYIIINETPIELRISEAISNKVHLRESVLVDIFSKLNDTIMM
jgi:SNF2 family DNA or RNA helicase